MRNFRRQRHGSYIFLPFSSVNVWNSTEHGVRLRNKQREVRKQQLPDLGTATTDWNPK